MTGIYLHAPPLTTDDCKRWACMEFWAVDEAIVLSLGYDPLRGGDDLNEGEAATLWTEYRSRAEIVERSGYSGLAKDPPPFTPIPNRNEVVFTPHEFVNWAKTHFPTFHEQLYSAVREKWRGLRGGRGQETRDSALEPKSLIEIRWTPNREMEAKAKQFAVDALETGCKCNHAELARYMNTNAFNDKGELIFNDPKIDEESMPALLLKAVREVFQERARNRVKGSTDYSKAKEPRPIHHR